MIRALVTGLALTALASPAVSLSCLPPDIVRTFEEIRKSPDVYWLLKGEFTLNQPIAFPDKDADGHYVGDPRPTSIRFSGQALRPDGSYVDYKDDMTLMLGCVSVWCGGLPENAKVFAAVNVTDGAPVLTEGPCAWHVIPFTTEAEERLIDCVANGACRYQDF